VHSIRNSRIDGFVQDDPNSTRPIMDYGKALRIARAMAGLQQKQLADLAGMNSSHVSLIEMGKRKPSVQALERLCKALGIPNHLFMLLGAEARELNVGDPDGINRAAESLARMLFLNAPRIPRRRSRRTS
jgi:transcriptional regulator with XRE-family HTH domain